MLHDLLLASAAFSLIIFSLGLSISLVLRSWAQFRGTTRSTPTVKVPDRIESVLEKRLQHIQESRFSNANDVNKHLKIPPRRVRRVGLHKQELVDDGTKEG